MRWIRRGRRLPRSGGGSGVDSGLPHSGGGSGVDSELSLQNQLRQRRRIRAMQLDHPSHSVMSPSPSAAATVRRPTADGGPRTPKAKGIAPFRPLFKGLLGPYLRAFKGLTSGNERQGAHYGTGIAINRRRQRGIKEASRRGQGGVKEAVLCAAECRLPWQIRRCWV